MTAQTVSGAVARRDEGPAAVVRSSRNWFASILPSHVEPGSFVALSCAMLRKNPKLAEAAERNPQSFMSALSECARLGLVPGDTFHLVPFEDRRNETVEITGITDYKGEVQLIYNAGAVASVKAEVIKEHDDFQWDPAYMDRPAHRADWLELKGPRGELVGAYAFAVMKDGAISQVVIMGRPEIERHKAMAKGTDRYDSPWKKWPESMWKKTAVHELEKWVPSSPEYRREQLRTAAEASAGLPPAAVAVPQPAHRAVPEQVYDAEIVDDPQNVPPAESATPPAPAAASPAQPPAGGTPLPPLPGEDDPDPTGPPQPGTGSPPSGSAGDEVIGVDRDQQGTATRGKGGQLTAVWTVLSTVFGFGDDEKPNARKVCEHIIGRQLVGGTTGNLSYNEARTVLDTLANWQKIAESRGDTARDVLIAVMAEGGSDG